MENSPTPLTEQEWAEHVLRLASFKGTMAEYCRQNNLVYESLRLRKLKREASLRKINSRPAFVKVEPKATAPEPKPVRAPVSTPEPKKKPIGLPDPEWLASFIRELQGMGR